MWKWITNALGKVAGWIGNNLGSLTSTAVGVMNQQHLTGAEREQNEFNSNEAAIAREFNATEAEKNRQFQADQSATAYQRAVTDMKAAGVNPALAMSNGAASTPSGSAATASPASGSGRGVPMTMSDLMAMSKLRAEQKLLEAQTRQTDAVTRKNNADAALAEIDSLTRDALNRLDLKLGDSQISKLDAETAISKIDAEFKPELLEQQLAKGYIEIDQLKLGISKILLEMKQLEADTILTNQKVLTERTIPALNAALVAANKASARNLDASAFARELENELYEKTGHRYDETFLKWLTAGSNRGLLNIVNDLTKFSNWLESIFNNK